jgi:hypothetical protein
LSLAIILLPLCVGGGSGGFELCFGFRFGIRAGEAILVVPVVGGRIISRITPLLVQHAARNGRAWRTARSTESVLLEKAQPLRRRS